MADDLKKAAKDDVSKSWKDVEATHKAHKDAADAVKALKDDASKDDCSKAMKDLDAAHKSHKDACDAHKDACGKACKAILGSIKDDSAKDDSSKAEVAELHKAVTDQGAQIAALTELLNKALAAPAASPLEIALAKAQGKDPLVTGTSDVLPELDPADENYAMKKAMRTPLQY